MSLIEDIRADAARRLQVSNVITSKVGTQINVREKFTAFFTVKNTDATFSFKNVKLKVARTEFATPVDGAELSYTLADQLNPGGAAGVSVQFTATSTDDEVIPADATPRGKPIIVFNTEPFAALEVTADLDTGSVSSVNNVIAISTADVDIRGSRGGR
ncbi:MAG TPA: hypothetical protein VFV34_24480 [Blastocatellia bacterium]|nr:hypothetical protein [Blastocatellia bacterium]